MSIETLAVTTLGVGTAVVTYGLGANALARQKTFFTAPREGTAEFVMRGNTVDRMIVVWEGRRGRGINIDDDPYSKYDIIDETVPADRKAPEAGVGHFINPLNWPETVGVHWVGVAPFFKIYRYDFVWTEEQRDDSGKIVPRTRYAVEGEEARYEGQTSFIYLKDTNYFFVVDDVKTSGGVPLRFIILVTVAVENPYKALFLGTHWIQRMGTAISDMVVRYAGQLSYEQIIESAPAELPRADGTKMPPHTLEELVVMLGDGHPDDISGGDLLTQYGTRIKAAKRHEVDFSLDQARDDYKKATTAKYVGEQEGLAEKAKAEGEAGATRIRAQAEKDRIDLVYGAVDGGDLANRMIVRRLEALEKAGAAGGSTIVLPDSATGLAGLAGLASSFTKK